MTIIIQEITDKAQWNGFLTSQSRGHLLQSYEWGELNQYLGGRIYRLGAMQNGRLTGTMMLTVSPVPIPLPVPGVRFSWLYSSRGPTVEHSNFPAHSLLIESVQKITHAEHAMFLRLEPNIADDDHTSTGGLQHTMTWVSRLIPGSPWTAKLGFDIRRDDEQLLANFKMTWRAACS